MSIAAYQFLQHVLVKIQVAHFALLHVAGIELRDQPPLLLVENLEREEVVAAFRAAEGHGVHSALCYFKRYSWRFAKEK